MKSIQALETKDNEDDDKVWLTYWCVFGIFQTFDDLFGFVLDDIPFYFYIKVGFFIWMMLPTTNGAQIIYNQAMKPFMKKHGHHFQKIVNDISEGANIAQQEAMKNMNDPSFLDKAKNLVGKVDPNLVSAGLNAATKN